MRYPFVLDCSIYRTFVTLLTAIKFLCLFAHCHLLQNDELRWMKLSGRENKGCTKQQNDFLYILRSHSFSGELFGLSKYIYVSWNRKILETCLIIISGWQDTGSDCRIINFQQNQRFSLKKNSSYCSIFLLYAAIMPHNSRWIRN